MRALATVSCAGAFVGLLVSAQGSAAGPAEEAFVKVFAVHCVSNVYDLGKIRTASELFSWSQIPEDIERLGAPVEAKNFASWMISESGTTYILGINEGKMGAREANVCSVAARSADAEAVVRIIKSRYRVKPINDEIEGFQRYREFEADISVVGKVIISVINADDPSVKAVNLSAAYLRPPK